MKPKIAYLKTLFILTALFSLAIGAVYGQQENTLNNRHIKNSIRHQHLSLSDSLIDKFLNSIYISINDPAFMSKNYISTFALLKIDINKMGKIADVKFSDCADTLFVKAFFARKVYRAEKILMERYVKTNAYKEVSILIPINYEPFHNIPQTYYYGSAESFMQFDRKDFTGKIMMLKQIEINQNNNGK